MFNTVGLIERHQFAKRVVTICLSLTAAGLAPFFLTAAAQDSSDPPEAVWSTVDGDNCVYKLESKPVTFPLLGPFLRLDFSSARKDLQPFRSLKVQDITATHDGEPITLGPGALQSEAGKPVGVYVLVDVSRSMRVPDELGFDKLQAVKSSLAGFVGSLADKDRAAIARFDDFPHEDISATYDKARLRETINGLTGRSGSRLYNAIYSSIDAAKRSEIPYLIVFSDGVDSTPIAVRYRNNLPYDDPLLRQFEHDEENKIIARALQYKVKIYAVEMGNDRDPKEEPRMPNPIYVYRNSLRRIAKESSGYDDKYIDLLKVRRDGLSDELKGILEEIKLTFKYDYSLNVPLAGIARQDNSIHNLVVKVRTENCQQSSMISYIWKEGTPAPVPTGPTVLKYEILINPYIGTKDVYRLSLIYLSIMLALALLTAVPPLAQRMTESHEARILRKAIVTVGRDSPHINGQCPGELSARLFKEGDYLLICPDCEQVHHLDCWHLAGGRCYVHVCKTSKKPKPLTPEIVSRYKLGT